MMKNFKYSILMAVAIVLGFSSCSSDDENGGVIDNSKPKSVFLKISEEPATYGEGAIVGATTVNFASGELFFVNSSGAILKHYTITSAATSATNIDMAEITGSGAALANLPGGISDVHIVGNVPSTVDLTAAGITNISQVKAMTLGVATQGDITKVNLYGSKLLTSKVGGNDNEYEAKVTLKPTVARIELTNVKAGGVVKSFQVDGIFIDNYYPEGKIDGTISSTLTDNGTDPLMFTDNSAKYATALKTFAYDWYAAGVATDVSGVAAPATGVWGYNLFATEAGSAVPRIIIRLSNFTTTNGSTIASPQFVTIKGLKDKATQASLTGIKSSEVYNIAADALIINEDVVTEKPNQSLIDVTVTVEVVKWKPVAVEPEL